MKKNSKIFYFVLSILIVLSVSGCNFSKEDSPVNPVFSEKAESQTQKNIDSEFGRTAEKLAEEKDETKKNIPEKEITDEIADKIEDKSKNALEEAEIDEEAYETQENPQQENINSCTFSITCKEILENTDKLDSSKSFDIPSDGIILSPAEIEFEDGASVFDILSKAVRENSIHMEFSKTPGTNSVYIEGIANIYEFDCGSLSGWMYTVNGDVPMVSASDYIITDGDIVEFIYVCSFFEGS